MFVHRFRNL